MYSNSAPHPHPQPHVAEPQYPFFPSDYNFDANNNSTSNGIYADWLWDTSFLCASAATPPQLQSQTKFIAQRSPTNTASTNTSSTGTGIGTSFNAWDWDDSFLIPVPGSGTPSGSSASRTSASASKRSTQSRSSSKKVEKRKRAEDVGGQENRPPTSRIKQQMSASGPSHSQAQTQATQPVPIRHQPARRPSHSPQKYVALSTQYVYAAPNRRKILSRVSVTDYRGNVFVDAYVRPSSEVVDLRSQTTGLMAEHLSRTSALGFSSVREQVASLIKNKIIIGHSIWTDLALLSLSHPAVDTRDVALYLPFHRAIRSHSIAPLKNLVWHLMMRNISRGHEHPLEEARAALDLFRSYEDAWETDIAKNGWPCALPPSAFQQYFS